MSTTPTLNLYRIIVLHGAPKDSHTSTEGYLAAENEEQVFRHIDGLRYGSWSDKETDGDTIYDDKSNKDIPFKDWVMRERGDLEDESGWEDAYYGVTKMGWEKIEGATQADIKRLLELGIAKRS